MKITYLPKDDSIIKILATWFYNEWAALSPNASVERMAAGISGNAGSKQVPLTVVAFNDQGVPIGAANLTQYDMSTRKEFSPWMGGVYVIPEERGKGIGSILCKRIEEEARRLGFPKIYLVTKDQQSLYSRLGWKTIIDEEYKGMMVSIMELQLSE